MEASANLLLNSPDPSVSKHSGATLGPKKPIENAGEIGVSSEDNQKQFSSVLSRTMDGEGDQAAADHSDERNQLPPSGNDQQSMAGHERSPSDTPTPSGQQVAGEESAEQAPEVVEMVNQTQTAEVTQLISDDDWEAAILDQDGVDGEVDTQHSRSAPLLDPVTAQSASGVVEQSHPVQQIALDVIPDKSQQAPPSSRLADGEEVVTQLKMAGVMSTPEVPVVPAAQAAPADAVQVAAQQASQSPTASQQLSGAGSLAAQSQQLQRPERGEAIAAGSVNPEMVEGEELLSSRPVEKVRESVLPPELQRPDRPVMMKAEALAQAVSQQMRGAQGNGQSMSPQSGRDVAPVVMQASDPMASPLLQGGMEQAASANRATALKGMSVPPQSTQWASELGERMVVMASRKIQTAEIRLNPPNMGVLEVKLALNGDQAQLVFQSGHASVRDALELSLPRLKEMLEQGGVQLTDVTVGERGQQQAGLDQSQGEGEQGLGQGEDGVDLADSDEVVAASAMAVGRMGLVNYYA